MEIHCAALSCILMDFPMRKFWALKFQQVFRLYTVTLQVLGPVNEYKTLAFIFTFNWRVYSMILVLFAKQQSCVKKERCEGSTQNLMKPVLCRAVEAFTSYVGRGDQANQCVLTQRLGLLWR